MIENIFIVILNYNGAKDTIECIDSIFEHIPNGKLNYTVLVVDNCSTDNSYEAIKGYFGDRIILLKSQYNGGYAYGNNVGLQYALDHGADYICILNNDTVLLDDFLTDCIDYLRSNSSTAFVGPVLLNAGDRLVQSSGGKLSLSKGKNQPLNCGRKISDINQQNINCDTIIGAAMIFRSSLIKTIGFIPEDYFLFYEEIEWCHLAKKAGYDNVCLTQCSLLHKGSQSLAGMSKMQEYLMERNRTLFVKRNATKPEFSFFLIYDFLRTGYRSLFYHVPFIKYIKAHTDGITERFDSKYVLIRQ